MLTLINDLLDQAMDTVRPLAEAKGLSLQVEVDAALRPVLAQAVGDPRRV